MAITKLTIQNFKSFDHVEVNLRNFNVVVGPNAAGKSNLIEAVSFLKDIAEYRLEDAVAIHGGIKVLRNFNSDAGQAMRVIAEIDDFKSENAPVIANGVSNPVPKRYDDKLIGIRRGHSTYDFSVRPHKKGTGFTVVHDELRQRITAVEIEPTQQGQEPEGERVWLSLSRRRRGFDRYAEVKTLGAGSLILNHKGRWLRARLDLPIEQKIDLSDISSLLSRTPWPIQARSVMLGDPFMSLAYTNLAWTLEQTSVYDFDPKKPKQAVPIAGIAELDGDGGNLAIVLQKILRSADNRRRFVNLVSDLLPFVDSVGVDTLAYNSLLAKLTERYSSGKRDMSVAWASDGTISVLAMVAALFFEEGELAIFEEPERNIHPQLIGRLVQMMKEASENKQIILTTHNPEMLRHSDLEDILLVQRDDDGNSTITRPADSETLKIFLENELGIEDLFVQNLLAI